MSEEELLKAMDECITTISKDDCEGWYKNMKKIHTFIDRCRSNR